MLTLVALAGDFRRALDAQSDDWADARFVLRLPDEETAARASSLLGVVNPARHRDTVRFYTTRRGAGHGPDVVARALARLDRERITGQLELIATGSPETVAAPPNAQRTLAASWEVTLATLPPDWSDIYAEIDLRSSDYLERAALLMSPLNPARHGGRPGFRFRCARSFGYGASPGMVRRCLERLDAEGIRGEVRIVRALSDTKPAATQGPVWYVGGKAV